MSKIYLPYRVTKFDTQGIFRFQQDLNVASAVLSKMPHRKYNRKRKQIYSPAMFGESYGFSPYNAGSSLRTQKIPPPIGGASTVFIAPIKPAHNATIVSLKGYWYDGHTKVWGYCRVVRVDFEENTSVLVTTPSTTGTTGSPVFESTISTTVTNGKIDLTKYTYYIEVVLTFLSTIAPAASNTDLRFTGCEIKYELGR